MTINVTDGRYRQPPVPIKLIRACTNNKGGTARKCSRPLQDGSFLLGKSFSQSKNEEVVSLYWNNHIEKLNRKEMTEIQSTSLRDLVQRVYTCVPSYRQKFQAAGLLPADIQGIEDIHKLPFTTKQDLRDNYPYGLFALPMSEIVRIHASSGTTGKATVVGYTKRDLNMWAEVMARALTAVGVTNKSFIQNAYGMGCLPAAGALRRGAGRRGRLFPLRSATRLDRLP